MAVAHLALEFLHVPVQFINDVIVLNDLIVLDDGIGLDDGTGRMLKVTPRASTGNRLDKRLHPVVAPDEFSRGLATGCVYTSCSIHCSHPAHRASRKLFDTL